MRLDPSVRTKVLMVCVVLAASCYINGCSSFVKSSSSTIGTIAVGVNATMEALDEMYKAGTLSEETKNKVIDIHKVYRASHRSLVAALIVYKTMEGEDKELQKTTIQQGILDLQVLVSQLSAILLKSRSVTGPIE